MDAILNVGLEMGSHNHECWPHVFRVTEYISSLEHSHFSDGSRQPPSLTAITQQGQQGDPVDLGLEPGGEYTSETAELGSSQPVIQALSIQELLREGGRGGRSMVDLKSGSLMSGNSAAKAVCMLSTQADRYVCLHLSVSCCAMMMPHRFSQLFSDVGLGHMICFYIRNN